MYTLRSVCVNTLFDRSTRSLARFRKRAAACDGGVMAASLA